MESSGFEGINKQDINEALKPSTANAIGGGTVDLTAWASQVYVTRKIPGVKQITNGINKTAQLFKKTNLARSSRIYRDGINVIAKGSDESAIFIASEQAAAGVGLKDTPTAEENLATGEFAWFLGAGQGMANVLLNKFPAKTVFTPMLAALSKPKATRNWVRSVTGAGVGAASFEFASAATDFEGYAYNRDRDGNLTPKSTSDFIEHFLSEYYKMRLLGAKSIFQKNGLATAFANDIRAMQGHNPLNVSRAAKNTGYSEESIKKPDDNTVQDIVNSKEAAITELGKSLQDGIIDQQGFLTRSQKINEDYNILQSQAELNIAKESIKAEDKSALKPTDANIRTLVNRLQRGEKLTELDNRTMVNTPLPIIFDRYGIDSTSEQAKAIESAWNKETLLNEILNSNPLFKAAIGTREREESYNFSRDAFEVGQRMRQLQRREKLNDEEKVELEFLEEKYETYQPGGYRYNKIQKTLGDYYKNLRAADIAQAEKILEATKEGERVSVESVEELQKIYDEAFPNEPRNVSSADGFYDPVSKKYYVNETQVKNIRNFTVDTHETGHFILRDALKNERGEVTEDGVRIIDEVLAELTPKQRGVVQERIDANYRFDANGNERAKKDYYEEYLTTLSDAIRSKQIVFKENIGNSLENLVPFIRKKGVENLELNAETGKNLFELIKSYSKGEQAGIEAAKEISRAAEGVEVADQAAKLSLTAEDSAKVNEIYAEQGIAGYEQILDLLKPTAKALARRFKDRPNYDEQLAIDAVMTGKRGMLDVIMDYNKKVEAGEQVPPLSGFINKSFTTKGGFKRYVDAIEPVVGKEFTADVTEAKGIAAEEVAEPTVTKEVRGPRKPTETTSYSNTLLKNTGVENKQELESKITEATKQAFADKEITRFGETRNIPESVAKIYGEMFGINPEAIYDKRRNFQKTDSEGLTRIKQFLIDNASADYARLPETKDKIKGGTFIPRNILNEFYKDGKLAITRKDYIDFIKREAEKPIYRDVTSQNLKGGIAIHIRNRMLEDLITEPGARAAAGAKFSETKQSGQEKLDSKIDKKALDLIRTDRGAKADVMMNTFPKFLPVDKFSRPTNWTSGNKLSSLQKRGFDIISDPRKIFDKNLKAEAEQAIASGDLINLAELKQTAKANEKQFTESELKAFNESFRTKNGPSWKKNLELKELHDKGVDLQIDAELAIAKTSPEAFAVLREYIYNPSLNSNANRNQATAIGRELGALERKTQTTDEHVFQAIEHANARTQIYKNIIDGKPNAEKSLEYYKKWIKDNYLQYTLKNENDTLKGNLVDAEGNKWTNSGGTSHPVLMEQLNKAIESGKKEDWNKVPSSDLRYFNTYKNAKGDYVGLNPNNIYKGNESKAQEYNVVIPKKLQQNKNAIEEQNKIIESVILTEAGLLEGSKAITREQAKGIIDEYVKLVEGKTKAETKNNGELPPLLSFTEKKSNERVLEELGTLDKALKVAADPKAPVKKIRVFDFDDTLARSNSRVIYEMPDGTTGKLNATQFAERAGELEAQGATFDFSEFSKVVDGKKGPVFKAIENIVAKRGAEDVFILTARPADAAGPIKEFMDALGVNLPIENIVGLGDGKAQAKARWITGKAAEGYNDFFFVDDAYKNVKAVRDALEVFDVKSKTQQAKARFSETVDLSKDFNDIIEAKTGIGADKVYSRAKAQVVGASKGSIFKGIPYSAQDFTGLLYETLSKGKLGDQQMAWYKYNLIDPFSRGVNDISKDRVAMFNDYKSLKKELGVIPKDLRKKLPGEPYTREQAVRVYTWNTLQGMEVPGVSKADLKTLNEFVNNNPELKVFAEQLVAINKGDGYAKPKETWLTGSITTDLLEGVNTTKRAKYLEQWQTNVDKIFSEANLNKLEAAYGKKYRKALENSLQRMKTGRNRSFSDDSLTGRFTDWLNGSIGVTMFFNTRSSLLQTISSVNFVNFTDNNPIAAAKAFGNQKQYWKDFKYLMNSDFLKERRGGLRMNVNEADIAEAANKNGPRGVINRLLQFGFTPTQIADSFAIASGGATFYRNRVKTYEKQGLSKAEAEAKAFEDFRETAEESQQSSRPDRISMQQAGPLGRPILAFGNTPSQYLRLTDKAIKDLRAGRGDAKTNISKIIYYTTVQNLIFNSLQQGLFAIAFGEADADDEKYENKYIDTANGMADSMLRGAGVGGAAISVTKNAIIRIIREQEKKQPKLEKIGYELTKIAPPVSSKLSKINQAARAYQWDKDKMMSEGFSFDNPAYLAGANVISATTNVPLDRAIRKVENVIAATEADKELWERLALLGGWPEWQIAIDEETKQNKPQPRKTKSKFKKSKIK